ncbi:hypothetical protein NI389_05510 [Pseudoalteromonas xiamenensis]|uniref:HAAS signaling domain-containing protein n=1 Tax=Pseudoalteromonas xiamenensis TaxID=882626 RepID=UPI0027E55DDC|nr:hypothetical protein [Pseudoalteromonas xiamenensis]WMN60867.1 hypothetical protein NI389_05510 [Pseudoalteromonas xiamenensis]
MMPIKTKDQRIQAYLEALVIALKGQDAALVQDALFDAESHFQDALEDQAPSDHLIDAVIEQYGSPVEIANYYIEMERVVNQALYGATSLTAEKQESGSRVSIFKCQSAYKALVYCFVQLPLSIVYIAWTVLVGFSSVVASAFVIGLPVLLFLCNRCVTSRSLKDA